MLLLAPAAVAAEIDGCPENAASLPADERLRAGHVVVVWKADRRLGHYVDGALARCLPVGLAPSSPPGPKAREGDRKTPEGWYRTSDKPTSRWYRAIAVHYPGPEDARRGLEAGLVTRAEHDAIVAAVARDEKPPQHTALGGEILIHGGGASDWTLGCVALEDADLDALRAALPPDLLLP